MIRMLSGTSLAAVLAAQPKLLNSVTARHLHGYSITLQGNKATRCSDGSAAQGVHVVLLALLFCTVKSLRKRSLPALSHLARLARTVPPQGRLRNICTLCITSPIPCCIVWPHKLIICVSTAFPSQAAYLSCVVCMYFNFFKKKTKKIQFD